MESFWRESDYLLTTEWQWVALYCSFPETSSTLKKTQIVVQHPIVPAHRLKHVSTRGAVTRGLRPTRGVRCCRARVCTGPLCAGPVVLGL